MMLSLRYAFFFNYFPVYFSSSFFILFFPEQKINRNFDTEKISSLIDQKSHKSLKLYIESVSYRTNIWIALNNKKIKAKIIKSRIDWYAIKVKIEIVRKKLFNYFWWK